MNLFSISNNLVRHSLFSIVLTALLLSLTATASVYGQENAGESTDPLKLFYRGQEAHEKGDLQSALKLYNQALDIAPEFPEAEFQRGSALISLGDQTGAEKSFRKALELRPEWTLPMTSLGALLVQNDRLTEAEKYLTEAIEADGNNFLAYAALTDLKIKSKAQPSILKDLLARVKFLSEKANPLGSIWISRGLLENSLGDVAAAKSSFARALAIEPGNSRALLEKAEIAIKEGDKNTSNAIAEQLLRKSPNLSAAKILKAKILIFSGEFVAASNLLDGITESNEEVKKLRLSITANTATDSGDLEKQLEKDGKNVVVLSRLCNLLRKDNPQKALEYCRRASEAEPDNLSHAVGFGAALVQSGRYQDAANLFRNILMNAPDNYTAHANLATALFQLKDFARAVPEFNWLAESKPDLPVTYYFLAISYDNLEKYMDAMANYQQFLRLADPKLNQLEIEKVNLRLPTLQKLIKQGKGKKKGE